jgi:hypothetical protein
LLTSPAFDGAAVLGTVKAKPFVVVESSCARRRGRKPAAQSNKRK